MSTKDLMGARPTVYLTQRPEPGENQQAKARAPRARCRGGSRRTVEGTKAGARCWLLIWLESSLSVPLSFAPDTEWESGLMIKVHAEDPGWGGGRGQPTGRKEGKIIHQEELFHSLSMCC